MTQAEWILKGETGISSKTMWAAINGVATPEQKNGKRLGDYDVPYDPADFRRCYKYVNQTGLTKEELQKVKEVFPWYAPFIDNWDELVSLFEKELKRADKCCPKTYELIKKLEIESKKLDGWIEISPNHWQRKLQNYG